MTNVAAGIRPAVSDDVPVLLELVHELAAHAGKPDAVQTSAAMLHDALFGPAPAATCHVAELDGLIVGFAVWYVTFSTWTGRPGLWLEDLFVRPEGRSAGVGTALLTELARVCLARGYARLEWQVLDGNTAAIGFYRSLGAVPQSEWTIFRVDGEALASLGTQNG